MSAHMKATKKFKLFLISWQLHWGLSCKWQREVLRDFLVKAMHKYPSLFRFSPSPSPTKMIKLQTCVSEAVLCIYFLKPAEVEKFRGYSEENIFTLSSAAARLPQNRWFRFLEHLNDYSPSAEPGGFPFGKMSNLRSPSLAVPLA